MHFMQFKGSSCSFNDHCLIIGASWQFGAAMCCPPVRLQVQFHLGMGTDPSGFVSYHRAKGIQLQAYSVLANSVTHHASHLT